MKENSRNPRKLTEKGLKDLEQSIKKFGIAEPPVLNKDLTLIGGHGRKKIFERLNITEVDCYVSEKQLNKKQVDELGIRLNKNIAGIFDYDILANDFEIDELLDWGFEEFDLGLTEEAEYPELKTGEKDGMRQMTFILTDEQGETVSSALEKTKKLKLEYPGNQNSNGNGLYKICVDFLND